jgi:hypothetical protein
MWRRWDAARAVCSCSDSAAQILAASVWHSQPPRPQHHILHPHPACLQSAPGPLSQRILKEARLQQEEILRGGDGGGSSRGAAEEVFPAAALVDDSDNDEDDLSGGARGIRPP